MNDDSLHRYRRQTAFSQLGVTGQKQLLRSKVLICGCGALGNAVATILARSGVGFLRLIDNDTVSVDNLHRQILFDENDAEVGAQKVEAAAEKLWAANSDVTIEAISVRFDAENADELAADVDLIVDATDNFRTRFLLNQTAVKLNKPFVSAGVLGASGQVLVVLPGVTPCLACLAPNPENGASDANLDTSGIETAGVLPPVVTFAASLEAAAAIKILSGNLQAVSSEMFTFDLWENRFVKLDTSARDPKCPVC
ncbi:MAG: HesA/MoeB/ThiF family protein, partial [Thermoguttaceae bacterium]